MAVTATKTAQDIITSALRKAGILPWGEAAQSNDASAALDELNLMLKGWQNMGYNLWTVTSGSLTPVAATASYTLSPVRPLRILSARWRDGTDLPMWEMTRSEYDDLPNKSATGTPTSFYYDRQREAATFYVWPAPSTVTTQTIEFTYERELEDITDVNDTLDMPGEWWEAVVYNLAVRLLESAPVSQKPPSFYQRAERLLSDAGAFDREGSVSFVGAG